MLEWFDYGKYTAYVWSSYGIGLLVLGAVFIGAVSGGRRTRARLKQQIMRAESRAESRPASKPAP